MKILVTGCAGFIGFHLSKKLLTLGHNVFGIDNVNSYYDTDLKLNRLKILKKMKKFKFSKVDITDKKKLSKIFKINKFKIVCHLAAQAGVRYSIFNPKVYFDSNIHGFFNIIELSRISKINHFIFASSSSVYGDQKKFPILENNNTDMPLSFYAASKKTNEIFAYSYSYIYNIKCTGLRFFTVYGPYGRPDMALFNFVKNIISNDKIYLYNYGNHKRDFTYIDDVVNSMTSLINKPSKNKVPFQILNIGNNKPKSIKLFVNIISRILNKKPKVLLSKKKLGDVKITHASNKLLKKKIGNYHQTDLNLGISKFISWYKDYYKK